MENQYDPFGMYAFMAQRPAAPQQSVSNQIAQQIMGQPAQTVGQGMGQLATGLGTGLAKFQADKFPKAPGGAKPSPLTGLMNLFTFGNNGGLY
ncbi:hypothetical protein ACQKKX_02410 [Neorhizobium sp. NPDC001467]|uniref:hypothetical protein n=1 Tax=Neorhizobium sp. NPDC001467 TaxID=3390595 RepID=UPI003D017C29